MATHECNQAGRIKTLEDNDRSIMELISDMRKENRDIQKENRETQGKIMGKIEEVVSSINNIKVEIAEKLVTKYELKEGLRTKADKIYGRIVSVMAGAILLYVLNLILGLVKIGL